MRVIPYRYGGFDYMKLPYADFVDSLSSTGCIVSSIGTDSGGYPVYSLSIGSLTTKPVIMIVSGIHGQHEWRSPYWVREFMTIIATGPGEFYALASWLRAAFDFFAIPLVTPCAYEAGTYVNANGVNVNRNFDNEWDEFIVTSPEQEKGSAPFSEPESRIVRDAVLTYRPTLFVDCHTWGAATPGAVFGPGTSVTPMPWQFVQTMRRLLGRNDINVEYLGERPTAVDWARKQTARTGGNIQAFYLEPYYLETEREQARIGVNMLLQLCLWMLDWHRKRILR